MSKSSDLISHVEPSTNGIVLTRPSGQSAVYLIDSSDHPATLIVIGFGGLPHGALIGLDRENRDRLRRWLDTQDAKDVRNR